jgi:hypothetical protein
MQATAQRTQFPSGWLKSGIAALALAGALAIGGVAVNVARHGDSDVTSASATRSTEAANAAHQRFVEINALLQMAARPATNYRFLDMNVLPESTLRTVVPNYRFRDMNILPGDDIIRTTGATTTHLREINLLPGDDTGDVAPWSDMQDSPY